MWLIVVIIVLVLLTIYVYQTKQDLKALPVLAFRNPESYQPKLMEHYGTNSMGILSEGTPWAFSESMPSPKPFDPTNKDRAARRETFDTFYNHDMAAQKYLAGSTGSFPLQYVVTNDRYRWSEKDPNGMNIYDHVYTQNIDENTYDYGTSQYNRGDILSMSNVQPSTMFEGQKITLQQQAAAY